MSRDIYNLLVERAQCRAALEKLVLGLNWSMAQVSGITDETTVSGTSACGLCFSPAQAPRTLPWAGTLVGRDINELAHWIFEWDPAKAVVGATVINAVINAQSEILQRALKSAVDCPPHLKVFHHFRPQLAGKKVVVIGHYPQLQPFPETAQWHCLERNPQPGDLPDTAAEYLVPESDWVFITASSIANKTLPRLLSLASSAKVVLMGPSLPWLAEWADFGVNYLAGVQVLAPDKLWQVACEGGGTRIFDGGCEYRLAQLS